MKTPKKQKIQESRDPTLCAWPSGCPNKRLKNLNFCRKHQPYTAGAAR